MRATDAVRKRTKKRAEQASELPPETAGGSHKQIATVLVMAFRFMHPDRCPRLKSMLRTKKRVPIVAEESGAMVTPCTSGDAVKVNRIQP